MLFFVIDRVTHPWERERERRGGRGVFAFLSAGADIKANTWGGSALERGHGTPLEPLAERSDALSGVLAVPKLVDATELVVGQTAMGGMRVVSEQVFTNADTKVFAFVSAGADTKANTMV